MIEKRAKAFVTSKGLVPVDLLAAEIGKGKTIMGLQRLFPMLDINDIFEAVNFYAENTNVPLIEEEKMLTLANVGKDKDDIIIEVVNLHQVIYIKLVAKGHTLYPENKDFAELMNQGLRICCLENMESIESNTAITDELRSLVNNALYMACPEVNEDVTRTKEDLDYDEFITRRDK